MDLDTRVLRRADLVAARDEEVDLVASFEEEAHPAASVPAVRIAKIGDAKRLLGFAGRIRISRCQARFRTIAGALRRGCCRVQDSLQASRHRTFESRRTRRGQVGRV
jgi:hypothetical protein